MKEKADLFFSFLNMLLRLYQTDMSLPVAHETGDIGVFSFFLFCFCGFVINQL